MKFNEYQRILKMYSYSAKYDSNDHIITIYDNSCKPSAKILSFDSRAKDTTRPKVYNDTLSISESLYIMTYTQKFLDTPYSERGLEPKNQLTDIQKICPYCHTTEQGTIKPVVRLDIKGYEPNLEPDYHEAIIDEEHGPSVMYLQGYVRGRGEYTGASYINYCPMCGRKLNKD